MTRAEVLQDLLANGTEHSSGTLRRSAAELDLPLADLLVIAGHPVPAHLRPPERDPEAVYAFINRGTYFSHSQLASLKDFVVSLAEERPAVEAVESAALIRKPSGSGEIVTGFIQNRGFPVDRLHYVTALAKSTIRRLLHGSPIGPRALRVVAFLLGWRFADLAVVAGVEPEPGEVVRGLPCHHLGQVFIAAIPLTTEQLWQAVAEADRIGDERTNNRDTCPDTG
ncbi:hypothetical protein DMH04_18675 [Kibdelosporangium aridum]|uniref:Uncharacterized protein n=1 Tax=Kibdelosporangium aridum TaxID=2030 RepID=A0A428ZA09_KIBAR|nr:hypothetical protein [Kibdelosporangium aridum]RSM84893.1 hypothetical protein DMH04_18675 [Kibdelosporangium aridum]